MKNISFINENQSWKNYLYLCNAWIAEYSLECTTYTEHVFEIQQSNTTCAKLKGQEKQNVE